MDPAAGAVGEVAFLIETGRAADAVTLAERLVRDHPDSPSAQKALSEARGAAGLPSGRTGGLDAMDLQSLDEEVQSLHTGDHARSDPTLIDDIEHSLDFENFSIPKAPESEFITSPAARPRPAAAPRGATAPAASAGPRDATFEALLSQADAELNAGRHAEAVATASRAEIMHPEDPRPQAIIDRARGLIDQHAREVEDLLYEAQRCLERREWSGAKGFLEEALARQPDHAEGRSLMVEVDRLLQAEESGTPAGASDSAIPLAAPPPPPSAPPPVPGDEGIIRLAHAPSAPRERSRSSEGSRSSSRSGKSSRRGMSGAVKALIATGIVLALGAGGFFAYRTYTVNRIRAARAAKAADSPDGAPKGRKAKAAAAAAAPDAAANGSATSPAKAAAPAPAPPDFASLLAEGKKALSAEEWDGAVMALEAATAANPASAEAADLLKKAQIGKAEADRIAEDLAQVKKSFSSSMYADALRILYRLPEKLQTGPVERAKRNAWFNFAVTDMQSGDCKGAITHFDEVLTVDPKDAQAAAEKKFAASWLDREKDPSFFAHANGIAMRRYDE